MGEAEGGCLRLGESGRGWLNWENIGEPSRGWVS